MPSHTTVAADTLKRYEGMVIDEVLLASWPVEQVVIRLRPVGYAPALHRWISISGSFDGSFFVDELPAGHRVLTKLLAAGPTPDGAA